jgi:cysteine-rich repeat protein
MCRVARAASALGAAGGLVALAAALWPATTACGGGAACGDGEVSGGEACDDGNDRDDDGCSNACERQFAAQVKWTLVAQEVPGFSESCLGVGASKVRLDLAGPVAAQQESECGLAEMTFRALVPGTYTVTGTLLDGMGMPVTKGTAVAGFTIAGSDQSITLNFPMSDFNRSYHGTYLVRLSWGGADTCGGAVPPVTETSIRLERDIMPIMSMGGMVIDGATPVPCLDANGQSSYSFPGLPWGKAKLVVTGWDALGQAQFQESFDTFVGAGPANPTFELDVQSLAPDAGPPDAGPADAGASDAATADAG